MRSTRCGAGVATCVLALLLSGLLHGCGGTAVVTRSAARAESVPAPVPAASGRLYVGDANGDGGMDGSDATRILQIDAGTYQYPNDIRAADANKDGSLDGSDATKILRWDAGIETWPQEQVDQPGTLTVTISPQAAIDAGARWMIDSDAARHASGESVPGLTAGNHTLKFTDVANYTKPADETVVIQSNQTTTVSREYTFNGPSGSVVVGID